MILRINSKITIDTYEIIFLKSKINYTNIFLTTRIVTSSHTLKKILKNLDQNLFLEINRGTVINKNYLKYFSNDRDEAFVTLDNNKTLEISRRKFDTVSSNLLNQSLN